MDERLEYLKDKVRSEEESWRGYGTIGGPQGGRTICDLARGIAYLNAHLLELIEMASEPSPEEE